MTKRQADNLEFLTDSISEFSVKLGRELATAQYAAFGNSRSQALADALETHRDLCYAVRDLQEAWKCAAERSS